MAVRVCWRFEGFKSGLGQYSSDSMLRAPPSAGLKGPPRKAFASPVVMKEISSDLSDWNELVSRLHGSDDAGFISSV